MILFYSRLSMGIRSSFCNCKRGGWLMV